MNRNTSKLPRRQTALNVAALTLLGVVGQAHAQKAGSPLTWYGITLYGTVDVGASYQSHGRPQSDEYSAGGYTFPNKASTSATSQFTHNGLSQSVLGVRGEWRVAEGWAALAKAESAINPATLTVTDNQKALVRNNGKAITSQETGTDSSLTGPFSMALYVGVTSKTYGQLTFGRQNTPLKDNFYKYDPMSNAAGTSAFGAFGTPAGGGSTENARLNNSIRYQLDLGNYHVDALYAGSTSSQGGEARQLGVGGKFGGFAVDGTYADKKQAVVAASLGIAGTSAISVSRLASPGTGAGYSYVAANTVSVDNALAGTVSDNQAWGLFAKYDFGGPVAFAGYEKITYSNPSSSRTAGFESIGGYTFAIINNGAYTTDKVLNVAWLGVKYPVSPALDLLGAAYGFNQNSYTGNVCAVPAATSPGTTIAVDRNSPCNSGSQRSYSLAGVFKYNTYLDLYLGAMASRLSGGMASGFAHTSVYNVSTGVRFRF
jgi:predicted porin